MRVLLVLVAVLLGVIVALVAGILAVLGGAVLPTAVVSAGVAFGGTVTLALLVEHALKLL